MEHMRDPLQKQMADPDGFVGTPGAKLDRAKPKAPKSVDAEGPEYEPVAGLEDGSAIVNFANRRLAKKDLDEALAEEDAKDKTKPDVSLSVAIEAEDRRKVRQKREELGLPPKVPQLKISAAEVKSNEIANKAVAPKAPEPKAAEVKAPEAKVETPAQVETSASKLEKIQKELAENREKQEALKKREKELLIEQNKEQLVIFREQVGASKDFVELYGVLQGADGMLKQAKGTNVDAIRMLVEESRKGFNTESLRKVTGFLGVQEKAVALVTEETEAKLQTLNKDTLEAKKALALEVKKSGPAGKVAANDKLNALIKEQAPLAAKLETLKLLKTLSKETEEDKVWLPSDEAPKQPEAPKAVEPKTETTETPKKKPVDLSRKNVIRPVAGMGGSNKGGGLSTKKDSEKPQKKGFWASLLGY